MPVVDGERLLTAVRRHAGLDGRSAQRTLERMLTELGGCLTWRAAHNLADCLPGPYAGAVKAGIYRGTPARFAPRTFVADIAAREGVDVDPASERVRAVFRALRECLPPARFEELTAELAGFRELLPGQGALEHHR